MGRNSKQFHAVQAFAKFKGNARVGDLLNKAWQRSVKDHVPKHLLQRFKGRDELEINELSRMGFERLYADSGGCKS
jgi:hypothetical protein